MKEPSVSIEEDQNCTTLPVEAIASRIEEVGQIT